MRDPVMHENGITRKASAAYGDEFLTDISPGDQPYPAAWVVVGRIQQYPSSHPKYPFCNTPAANPEGFVVFSIGWPEKKNPFTQEDLLDSEEELQELILRFKTSESIPYREILSNRLIALFHDAKEEDPDGVGITVGSLRHFYNFLQLHTDLKCPTISLTPEYDIYASWRGKQNRVFSVHFLPNGDTRFVIFKPNKSHPEKQVRLSGIATTDILMDEVSPDGELDWISE